MVHYGKALEKWVATKGYASLFDLTRAYPGGASSESDLKVRYNRLRRIREKQAFKRQDWEFLEEFEIARIDLEAHLTPENPQQNTVIIQNNPERSEEEAQEQAMIGEALFDIQTRLTRIEENQRKLLANWEGGSNE